MKVDDFKEGKTYFLAKEDTNCKDTSYILRCIKDGKTGAYIRTDITDISDFLLSSSFDRSLNYREATEPETLWLNACIQKGAFVPLAEVQPPTLTVNNSYQIF